MKNFTLGLNIVLLIAVGILFYLHFSSAKPETTSVVSSGVAVPSGPFKIAYFEIDSIENGFDLFKHVRSNMEMKEQEYNAYISKLRNDYIAEVNEFQKNAPAYSQQKLADEQQRLYAKEKSIMNQQELRSQELIEENKKRSLDIKRKIQDYLVEYNKEKGFAYIFSNSMEMDLIYYKDSAYNISSDLIRGLNERYKKN